MGRKRYGQVRWLECGDSFVEGGCLGAPDNAGTKVNQIGAAVDNDCGSRAGPVRIGKWVSRPKQEPVFCLAELGMTAAGRPGTR